MSALKDKIQTALDEDRMLILGAQVLLGFQYEAFFMPGFEKIGEGTRLWAVGGLFLQLTALALLMAPTAFHRIAARGEDTAPLHRFATATSGAALLPFAAGLAASAYVAVAGVFGTGTALAAALALLGAALFWWYGLALAARGARRAAGGEMTGKEETTLKDKIRHLLTEGRLVLPGAQALLGFQLTILFTEAFPRLPADQQYLHLASLLCIGLATILLMAPAAYHRIADRGEDTTRTLRFGNRMILWAMGLLALGITGDVLLVTRKTLHADLPAFMLSGLVLVMFFGLWFGYTMLRRRSG